MQKCTIALPSPLSFCQSNVIHPNDVNNIFLMSVMSIMSMNSIISIVFKMVRTGLSMSLSFIEPSLSDSQVDRVSNQLHVKPSPEVVERVV